MTGKQDVQNWLFNHAFPLWAAQGIDSDRGGFWESLDQNGVVLDASRKRLRTQCRQLYVFSAAHRMGWQGPGLQIAADAFAFISKHYHHPDGGWIFAIGPDNNPLGMDRDFYELAFCIFAAAHYYDVSRDKAALSMAIEAIAWLNINLRDKTHGGWQIGLDAAGQVHQAPREQNPHMHLFEALLVLMKVHPEAVPDWMLQEILWLAEDKFVDQDGHLREFFAPDWQVTAGEKGKIVEPGHLYEWVWILQRAAGLLEPRRCQALATRLYTAAEQARDHLAARSLDGLIADQLPLSSDDPITHRLWPQTEVIKAHCAMARFGDSTARQRADAAMDRLFRHYLSPLSVQGLWHEHLDATGAVIRDGSPATSFYHLLMAMDDWLA